MLRLYFNKIILRTQNVWKFLLHFGEGSCKSDHLHWNILRVRISYKFQICFRKENCFRNYILYFNDNEEFVFETYTIKDFKVYTNTIIVTKKTFCLECIASTFCLPLL